MEAQGSDWWIVFEENKDVLRQWVKNYNENELNKFDLYSQAKEQSWLMLVLDNTWFNAPDDATTRKIPGFFILCGLLDGTYR